jgi:DNA-binding NarL/FixJ family response regulator
MPPRKRVLIADDHGLILKGVANILEPAYELVGQATNGRELVAAAKKLRPDVVVLDIGMPELNGIEAARQLAEFDTRLRIIFLTQQLEGSFLKFAFGAGAHGFVAKQASSDELLEALSAVLRGHYFVTSLISGKPGELLARRDPKANPVELLGNKLSPRQREVLQLIAEGKSAKEIGAALTISTKTAEFHRGAIMDELGFRTTAELTRYALAVGIVTL